MSGKAHYRACLVIALFFPIGLQSGRAEEKFEITGEDRAYWAFQDLKPPEQSGIDAIIDAALSEKGLIANPPASREQLIRRAYFDLVGLAPTYSQIREFAADKAPVAEAFAKLVDRLLAMPEYGERWGRHWLDVARYAQTNGYERDDEKPNAWRYRDYVVDAFNTDKPYDRFILEQLAGDELADGGDEGLIATGFYRLGVFDDEPDDKRAAEFDGLDDMLRTTSETFLALTTGCARCHDHMFDPISQVDYYELASFFRNVRQYQKPQRGKEGAVLRQVKGGMALSVTENGPKAADMHLLVRGDAGRPAQKVTPRLPGIFGNHEPPILPTPVSTGRRLALARWIADPANPLTARVMSNRIWQYHFGRGIVATPNDFGKAGHPVSNPGLLDWLAHEFIKSGWSVKHMHRAIMNTGAYRRSSSPHPGNAKIDPDNVHHWRGNLRRLEAEILRDRILQASGALNQKRGGMSFFPALNGEVVAGASKPGRGWGWSRAGERNRRSIYAFVKRTMVYPFFEIFDYSNTEGSLGSRPDTTVAPQALLLLNSELVTENAARIAGRALEKKDSIGEAFRLVLGRDPGSEERATAEAFLAEARQKHTATAGQIQFRPDFPPALFKEYHSLLPAERFLRGPGEGWDYFKGKWTGGYEGIINAEADWPPFALFRPAGSGYRLSGKVRLEKNTARTMILLQARPRGQEFDGYALLLDAEAGSVEVRRYSDGKFKTLAGQQAAIPRLRLLDFSVEFIKGKVSITFNGLKILVEDSAPVGGGAGRFGVSAWGGPVSFDGLAIESAGDRFPIIDIDHRLSRFSSLAPVAQFPPGWSVFGGKWTVRDNVIGVTKEKGPKLLWDAAGKLAGEATFAAEMRVTDGDIAGLIMNVSDPKVGADNWNGYEVSLYLHEQKLVLGSHENNFLTLASVPAPVTRGKWHQIRTHVAGERVKVYLDGRDEPYIDFIVEKPLAPGFAGLRTWGATVEYRNIKVESGGRTSIFSHRGDSPPVAEPGGIVLAPDPGRPGRRAFAQFCSLLVNLNEFLYVD
ncbi:MAG: DUF1553 domain-containing protein [Verrucomicrobiaceae bacterium]|nr:DUF1553 domain-containing protein [Verrucomicrobiaceae bacterium]